MPDMRFLFTLILTFSCIALDALDAVNFHWGQHNIEDQNTPYYQEVKAYYDRCYEYYLAEQHDRVVMHADMGIALARQHDLKFLEALLLEEKALSLEFLDIDKSIEVYLEALEAYKNAGRGDWIDEVKFEGVGNAHTILIRMYARRGEMAKAMQHYDSIERIVQEDQYYTRKAMFESMAFAQAFAGDYREAIGYFKRSIALSAKAEKASGEIVRGLEENYALIGSYFLKLNQLDSAVHYIQSAQNISKDAQRSRIRGRAMVSRIAGDVHLALNEIDVAQGLLKEAYSEYHRMNDPAELARTAAGLATCYLKQNEYELATEMAAEAYESGIKSSDLEALQQSLTSLKNVYLAVNRRTEAFDAMISLMDVNQELQSRQNNMLSEAFAKKFESSEKQNEIDIQKIQISQQKTIIWSASLIALLLMFLAFFIYRTARHRKLANKFLEKQRDQLRELDQAKSRFFANISHELKTPLTLLLAPLENAIEKGGRNNVHKDLELAHRSGQKILELVNEIMDLSKLENGQLTLNITTVNLYRLLNRIVGAFHSFSVIKKVHLKMEYNLPKNAKVEIDANKFEKIINNLISNAIKFTPVNGEVNIIVAQLEDDGDQTVIFKIKDSGEGISATDQHKIFERYHQGQNGVSIQGGTGIGLALVSELTRLMNGNVSVESEPGEGSTFSIQLPLHITLEEDEGEHDREVLIARPEDTSYTSRKLNDHLPNILIIEDNLEMSDFLSDILSPLYQCTVAFNGQEGLSMMAKDQFDCITCDIMMPEMDGFQFIESLRKKELHQRTPVLMLTARSLEEDKIKGFALGVDDYVTKPFVKSELIARLNALIANKKSREAWMATENAQGEKIETAEETQLKRAESIIIQHLGDESFKVDELARLMNYSQRQLTRIIRKLSGLSPNNLIREIRLQKAYKLISSRQFATIAEVRHEVGFQNASYFSKVFKQRFGVLPGEVM